VKAIAVTGLLLLSGCTTGGGTLRAGSVEREPVPAAESPAVAESASRSDPGGAAAPPPPPRNAGAVSLQNQAAAERASGDFERSAATLERAIRIAPDDAALWLELGEVRLAQGRPDLAEGMAMRAAALSGDDDALRRRAESLASRARRSR
jgi:tetratricopeptide (TPR) repeat protein